MDALELFDDDGDEDLIALLKDVDYPVVMQKEEWDVPTSRPFDKEASRKYLGIGGYYTSTMAYMFVDALVEGYGTIKLHHILSFHGSTEYYEQKACLDFWYGVARTLGVKVEMTPDCLIGKPYFWQVSEYGYDTPMEDELEYITIMHKAVRTIMHMMEVRYRPEQEN